ncbi:hypothetical protein [Mangrovactinospora gilvigrisea]|uniref:hypothetical protein n=1 Tax=Mangrovactinospora gilvigrisea TaxID=1428644 RepID=UPI001114DF09|nr:hypothetical protein [Mangrovactinospora gilvigrisea]
MRSRTGAPAPALRNTCGDVAARSGPRGATEAGSMGKDLPSVKLSQARNAMGRIVSACEIAAPHRLRAAHRRRRRADRGDLRGDRHGHQGRCINRLRNWRGIATRYDKTPESYEAGLHLCGAMLWLRSIAPPS